MKYFDFSGVPQVDPDTILLPGELVRYARAAGLTWDEVEFLCHQKALFAAIRRHPYGIEGSFDWERFHAGVRPLLDVSRRCSCGGR